ncbi:MAG: DUF3089 domain-containing protein [Myxococcota bacterium]
MGRERAPTAGARLNLVAVALILCLAAGSTFAADAGVAGRKLVILDPGAGSGRSRLVFMAKHDGGIQKGPSGDPALLDATLEVFYGDAPEAARARFEMPQGPRWRLNRISARYVDTAALEAGGVKLFSVRSSKRVLVVAESLGDDPDSSIDLVAGGEPTAEGGIIVSLTIFNRTDASVHRMCTRFATADGSRLIWKEIEGGRGRKLIAWNGKPTACTLDYGQERHWLCRPGLTRNECFVNSLDAMELLPDGSSSLEGHTGSEEQPYDCFYVYPTVHLVDPPGNHDDFSDVSLELDALLSQAARLNASCRIFAPLYRQVTFTGFSSPDLARFTEIAYRDVKAAFEWYLSQFGAGRNFVILSHSQGTRMTTRLMSEALDSSPALRARLITALLIGGRVYVPPDQTTGGSLQNIPLCTADEETGCVIAFRSYAEGFPPVGGSNAVGPDGMDTACTNPAALAGGEAKFLATYLPTVNNQPLYNIVPDPGFGTPFVKYASFYAGECATDDRGLSYLEIRVRPGPGDVRLNLIPFDRPILSPGFLGTHILDYTFVLGDLIRLVELKAAAMP